MRTPTYMSFSSFDLAEKQEEEHYLKYLTECRPPKIPQAEPASVGSAFDAYIKAELHAALFGAGSDPKYEFEALFETQVEEHNRDWARVAGKHCADSYHQTGLYDSLLDILKTAIEPPRFEFDVHCELLGVPFLAKPDCHALLPGGVKFTHDWKVNGYCGKSSTSPTKGYRICIDGYVCPEGKQSRSHNKTHKQYEPMMLHGLEIDTGYLEDCSTKWADQLTLYSWSLGDEVGNQESILSIHQLVAKPVVEGPPLLRVAEFRSRVRVSYQEFLAKRLKNVWERITSGHVFRDLTREENDARMEMLDHQAASMAISDFADDSDFFNQVVRPEFRG